MHGEHIEQRSCVGAGGEREGEGTAPIDDAAQPFAQRTSLAVDDAKPHSPHPPAALPAPLRLWPSSESLLGIPMSPARREGETLAMQLVATKAHLAVGALRTADRWRTARALQAWERAARALTWQGECERLLGVQGAALEAEREAERSVLKAHLAEVEMRTAEQLEHAETIASQLRSREMSLEADLARVRAAAEERALSMEQRAQSESESVRLAREEAAVFESASCTARSRAEAKRRIGSSHSRGSFAPCARTRAPRCNRSSSSRRGWRRRTPQHARRPTGRGACRRSSSARVRSCRMRRGS